MWGTQSCEVLPCLLQTCGVLAFPECNQDFNAWAKGNVNACILTFLFHLKQSLCPKNRLGRKQKDKENEVRVTLKKGKRVPGTWL